MTTMQLIFIVASAATLVLALEVYLAVLRQRYMLQQFEKEALLLHEALHNHANVLIKHENRICQITKAANAEDAENCVKALREFTAYNKEYLARQGYYEIIPGTKPTKKHRRKRKE
jgi:phosphopantetheine adenylyltransferase